MRTSRASALSRNKIKKISQLVKIIKTLQKKGKEIVFTNGCFDILHYGHVQYLEIAKTKGDILVLGLNSDSSVRKIKGKNRPIVNQTDRSKILAGLESVDFLVIFNETTPLKTIQKVKPDILIKGGDWKTDNIVGGDFVKSYGGKVETIKLAPGRSTTNIIKRIEKNIR